MNPILASRFEQVRNQLQDLEEVLQANREDVIQQHEEKEDLLQEKWRQRKHLTTLNRIADDYDDVEAENQQYAQERKELRQSLRNIIAYTKALEGLKRG